MKIEVLILEKWNLFFQYNVSVSSMAVDLHSLLPYFYTEYCPTIFSKSSCQGITSFDRNQSGQLVQKIISSDQDHKANLYHGHFLALSLDQF